jgi:hypothetical protein
MGSGCPRSQQGAGEGGADQHQAEVVRLVSTNIPHAGFDEVAGTT